VPLAQRKKSRETLANIERGRILTAAATPMATLLIIIFGALATFYWTRRFELFETRYAFIGFAAHLAAAFTQTWLHEGAYRGLDMTSYIAQGTMIGKLLDYDFGRFAPEVLKVALHMDAALPFEPIGAGMSTGTITAVTGFACWLLGPSIQTICVAMGILASWGQLALYSVARALHPKDEHKSLLVGLLLVPSVVFWSSMMAKEAIVIVTLGLLCRSLFLFVRGRRIFGLLGMAVSVSSIGLIKPYLLFPFVLSLAAWFYVSRRPTVAPVYFVAAAALSVIGIAAIGSLFPEYAFDKLGESAALQREYFIQAGGGSTIELGDSGARTMAEQLPYVPLALINSLFRPVIFEVRNAAMLAAAIETFFLAVGALMLLWRFKWAALRRTIATSPTLAFSLVFTLACGASLGMVTMNLGSLSRYRVPMMPFYVTLMLLLWRRTAAKAHAEQETGQARAIADIRVPTSSMQDNTCGNPLSSVS
jgi:hypothetical protein